MFMVGGPFSIAFSYNAYRKVGGTLQVFHHFEAGRETSLKACRSLAPLSWLQTTCVTWRFARRGQRFAPWRRATLPKAYAESPPVHSWAMAGNEMLQTYVTPGFSLPILCDCKAHNFSANIRGTGDYKKYLWPKMGIVVPDMPPLRIPLLEEGNCLKGIPMPPVVCSTKMCIIFATLPTPRFFVNSAGTVGNPLKFCRSSTELRQGHQRPPKVPTRGKNKVTS